MASMKRSVDYHPNKHLGEGLASQKNGLLEGNGPHQKSLSIMHFTRQDLFDMNLLQNYHSGGILSLNMTLFHLTGNALFFVLVLYHPKQE